MMRSSSVRKAVRKSLRGQRKDPNGMERFFAIYKNEEGKYEASDVLVGTERVWVKEVTSQGLHMRGYFMPTIDPIDLPGYKYSQQTKIATYNGHEVLGEFHTHPNPYFKKEGGGNYIGIIEASQADTDWFEKRSPGVVFFIGMPRAFNQYQVRSFSRGSDGSFGMDDGGWFRKAAISSGDRVTESQLYNLAY
jgi:hypothetical protein